jgi:serine/threonine protein kinase
VQEDIYFSNTDIWSLGCVIYELMYLNHPFSNDIAQYITLIYQQMIPTYDTLKYSSQLIGMIQ